MSSPSLLQHWQKPSLKKVWHSLLQLDSDACKARLHLILESLQRPMEARQSQTQLLPKCGGPSQCRHCRHCHRCRSPNHRGRDWARGQDFKYPFSGLAAGPTRFQLWHSSQLPPRQGLAMRVLQGGRASTRVRLLRHTMLPRQRETGAISISGTFSKKRWKWKTSFLGGWESVHTG